MLLNSVNDFDSVVVGTVAPAVAPVKFNDGVVAEVLVPPNNGAAGFDEVAPKSVPADVVVVVDPAPNNEPPAGVATVLVVVALAGVPNNAPPVGAAVALVVPVGVPNNEPVEAVVVVGALNKDPVAAALFVVPNNDPEAVVAGAPKSGPEVVVVVPPNKDPEEAVVVVVPNDGRPAGLVVPKLNAILKFKIKNINS